MYNKLMLFCSRFRGESLKCRISEDQAKSLNYAVIDSTVKRPFLMRLNNVMQGFILKTEIGFFLYHYDENISCFIGRDGQYLIYDSAHEVESIGAIDFTYGV